jgi:hypothetical protein
MSDWKRSTKEVPLEQLRPELIGAINHHLEQYNLGAILADALICVQTDSEKIKKGLFGGAEIVYTGAVITPRWLVWAVSGIKTPPAVSSALLQDVTVQDYSHSQFAKMIPDTGLTVSGKFTDVSEHGSAFIGLDDGPAGKRFKETVIDSVRTVKK